MKRIVKTIGLACLAGLFAVTVSSCKKTEDNTTKVVLTMEEIEDVYPGNERAYINMLKNGKTYWNRNDRIRAYNFDVTNDPNAYLNSTTAIYECGNSAEDQAYATFYGPNLGTLQSDAYRFFYPVGMVKGNVGPYNIDTFMVSSVQNRTTKLYNGAQPYVTVDPTAMPLASKNTSLTNFTMHHVFGYLNLVLFGQGLVDRVVLTDPNHHLTGYATMRMDKVEVDNLRNIIVNFIQSTSDAQDDAVRDQLVNYVYNPDELNLQTYPDGNTITLDCSDDPVDLSTIDGKNFIFAVRPGALWWDPDAGQEPWYVTIYFNDATPSAPLVITGADLANFNLAAFDPDNRYNCRALTSRSGKCTGLQYHFSVGD